MSGIHDITSDFLTCDVEGGCRITKKLSLFCNEEAVCAVRIMESEKICSKRTSFTQ